MALTRIKSQSILDREVREQDLADGAVTFDKILVTDVGNPGDVLTVDAFGNLLFAPANGTATTLGALADVDVAGATQDQVLAYDDFTDEWRPITIAGVGATSNTYIVADIIARNALVGTIKEGDQAFVRTGASGEWEMYLYDSGFPTNPPWVLLSTADSARTDANTIEYTISWDEAAPSPILLGNVSQGSRVTLVTIEVDPDNLGDTFNDPGVTFSVGDAGDAARLIDLALIDLETAGAYVNQPDYVYTSAVDTDIFLTFDFGAATQGTARVVVTHV